MPRRARPKITPAQLANAPTCQQELISILASELDAQKGSFLNLETQIVAEAKRQSRGQQSGKELKVDRRKLAKLVAGEDVALSFTEMAALDIYLASRNRS